MAGRRKNIIGLISSVQEEGDLLRERLSGTRKHSFGSLMWHTGRLGNCHIVSVVSGIGKVNSSHAASLMLQRYSPSFIINFGIGGAYPLAGLCVGDVAVATKEIYADEGVSLKEGFRTLEYIGIPLVKTGGKSYFNEFPLEPGLCREALSAAKSIGRAKKGIFATVSACTGTGKGASLIAERFRAICENMEGAAVAQISRIYGVPMAELRGISNIVEDRDTSGWDIPLASHNCQEALIKLLESIQPGLK